MLNFSGCGKGANARVLAVAVGFARRPGNSFDAAVDVSADVSGSVWDASDSIDSSSLSLASLSYQQCAPGEFQPSPSSVECSACPAGRFTSATGMLACDSCKPSQYNPLPLQSSCLPCPPNSLSSDDLASCECQQGFYNSSTASSSSTSASTDSTGSTGVGIHDAGDCLACPEGASCSAGRALARAGWWPMLGSSSQFVECLNNACGESGECDHPYRGNLCAECMQGHGRGDQHQCRKCLDVASEIMVLVAGALAFVLLIGLLSVLTFRSAGRRSDRSIRTKILLSGVQFNM